MISSHTHTHTHTHTASDCHYAITVWMRSRCHALWVRVPAPTFLNGLGQAACHCLLEVMFVQYVCGTRVSEHKAELEGSEMAE